MKLKLKLLTAAVVLAASGSAHALILDGSWNASQGNGELFMTLWDEAGEQSYILDLNIRMNDVLAGVALGQAWTYPADANMNTFLGMVAPANRPNLRFAMGAMDSVGANNNDYHRYITTASVIDLNDPLSNFNLQRLATAAIMLGDVNTDIGNNTSLIVTDINRPAYAGYALWGDNWGGKANFTATGPIGQPLGLYLLRQSTGLFAFRHQPSIYQPLTYNGNPYVATLDMSGNLTIAPVPEPETYALMLAGLGLVGWMARRRKA